MRANHTIVQRPIVLAVACALLLTLSPVVSGGETTAGTKAASTNADGVLIAKQAAANSAAWRVEARRPESNSAEDKDARALALSRVAPVTLAAQPVAPNSPTVAGCPITGLATDGGSSGNERAPNLRNRFGRSVYLIKATELAAAGIAPGMQFSQIGWNFLTAPGVNGTNSLIVYMQNTADLTNLKSTSWSAAISGMTIVHNAATAIPNVTGTWDIALSAGGAFAYGGGGLYIAFDAAYPVGTLSATTVVACNSTGLVGGLLGAQSNTANPTTLAASSFRPETRLTPAVATILNDESVDFVMAYGALPRDLVGPEVVQAVVTNRGANPAASRPVTLNVTGANPFSDSQPVPALAACGGRAVISFAPLPASTLGSDTLSVAVPADDVASNNNKSVPRNVTVPRYSYKYPGTTASGGVGLTGATGAFAGKFTTTFATSVTAVELEFALASTQTYRVAIYADSGLGTPGPILYVDGADRTVGVVGPVTIPVGPVPVGPGNFFVGIQQTNATNASLSFDNEVPIRVGKFYVATPLPETTWFDLSPGNNFKLNIGVILDACAGGSAVCDDGNVCTIDACAAATGCTHSPLDCTDTDPCTADSCDPLAGCVHAPIAGCSGFPPAGTDNSPTTGIFRVDVNGLGPVDTSVGGQTRLQWSNPSSTLPHTVQTELLSLDLVGSSPSLGSLAVRAGSQLGLPPSLGQVVQNGPGSDFPAHAFFDVFFEITVNGTTTLHNSEPLRMEADITEIPPRNIGLRNANSILITGADPSQVSVLQTAQHWMCPPPFPPSGGCPVPCARAPFPVCSPGDCPGTCSGAPAVTCRVDTDCPVGAGPCVGVKQCVANSATQHCECKSGFPVPGTDLSPTTGIFRVDVTGLGTVDTSVAGQTLLQWQNPVVDPATQRRTVQTEMLNLDLTGSDPTLGSLHVRAGTQNGLPATLGKVTQNDPGGDFPANAFFDVFFDIEVNGVTTLRNSQPLVMRADITEIPPRSIALRNDAPVQIATTTAPGQISIIQTAAHWMCPPPFPPPGVPCLVPCDRAPYPVCSRGTCPTASQQCVPQSPFFDQDGLLGKCVCVGGFPPAGTDNSPTTGIFHVELQGIGPVETAVSGTTLLQWQNPVVGPGGQRTVQTELVSLDLQGSSPSLGSVSVHGGSAQGLQPSTGLVTPIAPGSDFPANAFFDVFFEVTVNGTTTLRNDQPLVMRAPITEIPPRNLGLQNAAPVSLRNLANPSQINTIQTAQHWMCPPPFPPPGQPCPVPCDRNPYPLCKLGSCPADSTGILLRCVPDRTTHACKCVRPGFPPHGADLSPTSGLFRVDIAGIGVADAAVSGQVLLRWQDPITGPGGERTVQTEMVSLDLAGSSPTLGPLHVRGGSSQGLPPSLGQVTPIDPGGDFPANAFFDVFFEVQAGGQTLVNDQPLRMEADITEIPPRSIALRNAAPVPLRNVNVPGQPNQIQTAAHWMCPPPFPPPGQPCPVACNALQQPLCSFGVCPNGLICKSNATGNCGCIAPLAATSGVVPGALPAVPLKLGKAAGGQLTLTWGSSCLASDTDYGIYEGVIPSYYSHTALNCTTGGATTATITPSTGGRYYLVTPHGASVEGSYGTRSSGPQRPQGTTACLPQSVGTCP